MSLRVGDADESALFFKRKDQDYESNNEPPKKVKLENHTEGASELVPGFIGDKAWKILAAKTRHHKFFGKKFLTTKILFVINETFSTKTSSSTTNITKSTYLRLWISNYCKAVRIHPISVKPYPPTHNHHNQHQHHHHHHHHHSSSNVSTSFNYSLYIKLFHYMDLTEHPEIIIEEKKIQDIILKYIKEKKIGEIYEGEEEFIVKKKNEKLSNSITTIHNVRKEIDMKLEQVAPPYFDEPSTHVPLSYLNTVYHAPVHHLSLGPDEKPDEITSFYPHSHIDGLTNPRTTNVYLHYDSQKLNNKLLTTDSLGNFFMNFDWPKNGRIPLLKILSNTFKKRNFYVNALLILIADYAASLPTQKQMSEIRIAKWRETLLVSR